MIPREPELPRQIDRSTKHRGRFWIESADGNRFEGTLRFKRGLPKLTLKAPHDGQVFALLTATTIFGELKDGTPITLWNRRGWPPQVARDSTLWQRHLLGFDWALIGIHVSSYESARFSMLAVTFRSIANWSRFEEPLPPETEQSRRPQHRAAQLTIDGHRLSLTLRDPQRIARSGAKLNTWDGHHAHFLVEIEPAASPRYLDVVSFDLQALMTFCYQQAACITGEFCARVGDTRMAEIIRPLPVGEKEGITRRESMVLTPSDLPFEQLIEAWWPAINNIYPVTQVLSKEFYAKGGFLESSATSAVAATERMHQAVGATKEPFKKQYLKEKRQALRTLFVSPNDQHFLQHLLDNSYMVRPSLEVKLRELAEFLGADTFTNLDFSSEEWISMLKRPRNLLAHTGSHVSARSTETAADLYRVDAHTRSVLTLVTLKYFGVGKEGLLRAASALQSAGKARLRQHGVDWVTIPAPQGQKAASR